MINPRTIRIILQQRATYGYARRSQGQKPPTDRVFSIQSLTPYYFEYQICPLTGEEIVARIERKGDDI